MNLKSLSVVPDVAAIKVSADTTLGGMYGATGGAGGLIDCIPTPEHGLGVNGGGVTGGGLRTVCDCGLTGGGRLAGGCGGDGGCLMKACPP